MLKVIVKFWLRAGQARRSQARLVLVAMKSAAHKACSKTANKLFSVMRLVHEKPSARPALTTIAAATRYSSAHARSFLVAAEFGDRQYAPAWGRTLKEAEQWAAHEALLLVNVDSEGEG